MGQRAFAHQKGTQCPNGRRPFPLQQHRQGCGQYYCVDRSAHRHLLFVGGGGATVPAALLYYRQREARSSDLDRDPQVNIGIEALLSDLR